MNPRPAPSLESRLQSRMLQFCDSLREETKKLAGLAGRLRRKIGDPRSASRLVKDSVEALKNIESLRGVAVDIAEEWDRDAELAFLQLEATLQDVCAKRKWRLDGQWPDFIVEYGVPVHIVEGEKLIVVGTQVHVVPDELEKKLAVATADLIPKKFSPQEFMQELQKAYDTVTGGAAAQAPIYDVYRALVIQQQSSRFWRDAGPTLFTPMSIDQFRARFSRMLQTGIGTANDGRELRLFPPLNPKDALFLFQPSERRFGFVGRIEFVTP